jgi:hypothetical protein
MRIAAARARKMLLYDVRRGGQPRFLPTEDGNAAVAPAVPDWKLQRERHAASSQP